MSTSSKRNSKKNYFDKINTTSLVNINPKDVHKNLLLFLHNILGMRFFWLGGGMTFRLFFSRGSPKFRGVPQKYGWKE